MSAPAANEPVMLPSVAELFGRKPLPSAPGVPAPPPIVALPPLPPALPFRSDPELYAMFAFGRAPIADEEAAAPIVLAPMLAGPNLPLPAAPLPAPVLPAPSLPPPPPPPPPPAAAPHRQLARRPLNDTRSTSVSPAQLDALKAAFQLNRSPSDDERYALARRLRLRGDNIEHGARIITRKFSEFRCRRL